MRVREYGKRLKLHSGRALAEYVAVTPNVRAKLPAEAGVVSPVRENVQGTSDRAYNACRSGSA